MLYVAKHHVIGKQQLFRCMCGLVQNLGRFLGFLLNIPGCAINPRKVTYISWSFLILFSAQPGG